MAILVICGSCRSRFQLDEALLKGAKGARVRCRNCGDGIVVNCGDGVAARNGEALKPSDPPAAEAGGQPSPPPASQTILRVEDLFLPPPDAVSDPDSLRKVPPGRSSSARLLKLLALLFLAAAGVLFFYFPQAFVSRPPAPPSEAPTSASAGPPAYEIREVKGYLGQPVDDRILYVIRGTVANVGKGPSGGIRVRAALIGTDNQVIARSGAFAGNLIDETLLQHMNPVRIEEFLGLRYGEGNVNRDIPTGGVLPFMVVFFDPPGPIGSFVVEAMDADGQVANSPSADPEAIRRY